MTPTSPPHSQPRLKAERPVPSFPRYPLYGAAFMIAFSFVAAWVGVTYDIGTVRNPTGTPVDIRDIVFVAQGSGDMTVTDARTGRAIAELQEGQGGFVLGSLRGLNYERGRFNVPLETPWRLIRWETGRVTLSDLGTGQRIHLEAFGKDNHAAFARFLDRSQDAYRAAAHDTAAAGKTSDPGAKL